MTDLTQTELDLVEGGNIYLLAPPAVIIAVAAYLESLKEG